MKRDQKNLLMYLETCMVDYGGKVENRRMNADDFSQVEAWKAEGLIRFGRLFSGEANNRKRVYLGTHWVLFTDKAWELAHRFRRERAARLASKVDRNDPEAVEKSGE